MTMDEFEKAYKGKHDKMHDIFYKAAVEQGTNQHVLDAHFEDFNTRIHEMVGKMRICEKCKAGEKCSEHVFEVKNKLKVDEKYYKVKELIDTQTHDKLKDYLFKKLCEDIQIK